MNFRTIAKFCLLLVIIGFFMPMGCKMNAFHLASNDMLDSLGIFAMSAAFISAIIGVLIGVLLIQKIKVPIAVDWLITLLCFICIIAPFYNIGYNQGYGRYFQSGVYVILIGSIAALFFQIVSAVKGEKEESTDGLSGATKKCPFCANTIKSEATFCQFCGKEVPKFIPTHRVKLLTAVEGLGLREARDVKTKSFTKLPNGTEVLHLNTAGPLSLQGRQGEWFEVKTKENVRGWCFSGSLEKI